MTTLDSYLHIPRPVPRHSEQFADFYCGAGAFSQGVGAYFSNAVAVDINADACATFWTNHPKTRVYRMSVKHFLNDCVRKDFDGLTFSGVIGGPPCQGFSVLNKNAAWEQAVMSPRVRQMRWMVDGIGRIKPQWVAIENVASVPRAIKIRTVAALRSLGYKVVSRVIRASDYGSVQIRRRWVTIGHLYRHVFPRPAPVTRRAADILDANPDRSEMDVSPATLAAIKNLPAGRWVSLPGQAFKAYYVVEPHKLLPAVVNPTKLRYVRPDRSGYLTKSELERAQGFPAGYKIVGNLSSWGQQLANAVPVELRNAIGAALAATPS